MTGPGVSPAGEEFAALSRTAHGIDPGAPPRPIRLVPGDSSFAFTLDNDLIKLVTLQASAGSLTIAVRYATDVVLEQERHVIRPTATPKIVADGLGLVVSWRAPLIAGLRWPEISRTRRF